MRRGGGGERSEEDGKWVGGGWSESPYLLRDDSAESDGVRRRHLTHRHARCHGADQGRYAEELAH